MKPNEFLGGFYTGVECPRGHIRLGGDICRTCGDTSAVAVIFQPIYRRHESADRSGLVGIQKKDGERVDWSIRLQLDLIHHFMRRTS